MSKGFFLAPVAAIMLTLSSFLPAAAQTSACALHDQMCIYHGIGRQMGYDPSGPTSITATANWDQPNDADLHALLPTGNTYSTPTEALPGYPLQLSEPFYPDVSGAHIYPNHYESQINGGAATATHSGDAGGGLAPYPGQPGCDPAIQSSVTCEAITVQGEVPSGVYSYAIHAFPASGSSFPLTNFSIDVRASGNMVLVSDNPGLQINPETGLIRQTGSFQGAGATTSQLDVYALNVGHAGHVGGVTIPQMELVSLSDGTQRYQPAEPLLFDETPSIQDQIAGAFLQRDQQVAYYEGLREQEKQRLAYLAELARARAAYNKWLADQEKAQAQQEKLVYMACPAPLKSCVPSYVQGEKFVLAQPATPAPCNPKYASCVTPPAKFWEPAKSWEQIVSETYQQSMVLPKNEPLSFEEYAPQRGITLEDTSGAGSLVKDVQVNIGLKADTSTKTNDNAVDRALNSFYAYRETELKTAAQKCVTNGGLACFDLAKESLRTSGQDFYLGTVETLNDCVKGGGVACGETILEFFPFGKIVYPAKDVVSPLLTKLDNGADVAKIDNSTSVDTIPAAKVDVPQVNNPESLKVEQQLANQEALKNVGASNRAPWVDDAKDIVEGGTFSQCTNGSCVSATGQNLTGGALSEAQLLDQLGEWSNPESLALQLNSYVGSEKWVSKYFYSGSDALTIANQGQFGAVLKAYGFDAHMVSISPNATSPGEFTVLDTARGISYTVDAKWINNYVIAGVWEK